MTILPPESTSSGGSAKPLTRPPIRIGACTISAMPSPLIFRARERLTPTAWSRPEPDIKILEWQQSSHNPWDTFEDRLESGEMLAETHRGQWLMGIVVQDQHGWIGEKLKHLALFRCLEIWGSLETGKIVAGLGLPYRLRAAVGGLLGRLNALKLVHKTGRGWQVIDGEHLRQQAAYRLIRPLPPQGIEAAKRTARERKKK